MDVIYCESIALVVAGLVIGGKVLIDIILVAAAVAASLAGILVCWQAWRVGTLGTRALCLAAAPWVLATCLWIARFGVEIGIALALETGALIAFAFILTRVERRPAKTDRERAAPPSLPRSYWRGAARAASAGLLGFAAAMGLAVLFAIRAPLAEQTRLILAALAVPSLWCAAIVWTACDRRLGLQSATFTALALGCVSIAYVTV